MKATNNDLINYFIIDTTLVKPVEKIIMQLNNREFRDSDIKWLDAKLVNFTDFACKTLGINIIFPNDEKNKTLNNFVLTQYTNRFTTLLNYFKTI